MDALWQGWERRAERRRVFRTLIRMYEHHLCFGVLVPSLVSFLRESKKSGSQFGLRDILTDTIAPGYGKDRPFNKPYTLFQTPPR